VKCTDCGGGVPGPGWQRCEEHAMARLRTIMGGAPAPSVIHRRYKMNDLVLVQHEGEQLPGKIARCPKGDDYAVKLDRGGRVYVTGDKLKARPSPAPQP
jgi:hypothetical protein